LNLFCNFPTTSTTNTTTTTMNSQLDLHLETFDSDEEFSEAPLLHEEEHIDPILKKYDGMMNPITSALLKLKASLRRFVKPRSIREALEKTLWMLPVAIVLGDYIGMVFSTSLSIIAVVLMQLKPNPPRDKGAGDASGGGGVISNIQFLDHYDDEEVSQLLSQKKKQVQDCRKEVSRLLGLAGAPPLDWKVLETQRQQRRQDLRISDVGTIAVVKFLEAHVQFLLTIDKAYRSFQISTSLHLGLGPASQCVERVERAAIAREFRNRRKQSIGASLIREGVGGTLEPQRPGKSPVLALASARTHLAKSMVEQSNSLIQVWKGVRLCAATNNSTPRRGTNPNNELPNIDQLYMPDVVDLSWVKLARHQLAGLISQMMDYFCTLDVLQTLSEGSRGPRSRLEESMWNVRNAREHLLCTLLLGKKPATEPLSSSSSGDTRLLQSLIHYRDQLDALKGAIWSHCIMNDMPADQQVAVRKQWWSQVTQLGATCRALEAEIGQTFFFEPAESNAEENDGEDIGETNNEDPARDESGKYEHGVDQSKDTAEKNQGEAQTKTMVFKGKGVKEDRSKNNTKQAEDFKNSGTTKESDGGEPLPPRDTVSEQQLVKELKNRIQTICLPDDDDENLEDIDPNANAGRQPATSHFLGATGTLLSELKVSLPVMDNAGEEIIGE
jgi:hypothetical protein